MAKDKKSFLLYCDIDNIVQGLTDKEAGQLFKHVLSYVNDRNPEAPSKIVSIAFEPIKQSLKRDLQKYETIKEKRRLAGQLSAESKRVAKEQQNLTKITHVEFVEQKSTKPTVSDNDSVSDSVSVIDDNNINSYGASEKNFFHIGIELNEGLPGDVAMKYHRSYLDQRLYGTDITHHEFVNAFNTKYAGDSFSNVQHFRNSIKSIIERLINQKNGIIKSSFNNDRPGLSPGNLHSGRKNFSTNQP